MAVKMRLQRFGKKGQPVYHIVVADGRSPRDGRFIEKIGVYNPVTQPAEITIDIEKALHWINAGAQPTDTVNAILSFKGVLLKKHLMKGVEKGALTAEQADAKFNAWVTEKEAKINSKIKEKQLATKSEIKARLEAEKKVREEKEAAIAKKLADLAKANAPAEEEAPEAPAAE
jgi:small subunit ribosomal protein S16